MAVTLLFFQKEIILNEFNEFLCVKFGMGRVSEGHVNFSMAYIAESIDVINELEVIDEAISNVEFELKRLKLERTEKKKRFVYIFSTTKRTFPMLMFDEFYSVLDKIISSLLNSSLNQHLSSNSLKLKMLIISKRKSLSAISSKRRKKRKGDELVLRKMMTSNLISLAKHNVGYTSDAMEKRVLPIWDKNDPGTIKMLSPENDDVKVFNVYDPGYLSNPFSEFMMKL